MAGRVLIVHDDVAITRALYRALAHAEYFVSSVASEKAALERLSQDPSFDLVIVSDVIDRSEGRRCCERLRERGFYFPVLVLGSAPGAGDPVAALAAGADEFIPAPFEHVALLARVSAHLRRAHVYGIPEPAASQVSIAPDMVVDFKLRTVSVRGKPADLTRREFELLNLMAQHPNTALAKKWLFQQVWGSTPPGEAMKPLAVTIHRLRAKLETNPASPTYLLTVPGYGYKLMSAAAGSDSLSDYQSEIDELKEIIEALVLSSLSMQNDAEQVRAAASRLEEIVHGMETVVWEADASAGRFSYLTEQAASLLGRPAAYWLGHHRLLCDHIHPGDRKRVMQQMSSAIAESDDFELEYRAAFSADEKWLLNMVYVTRDSNGTPDSVRGVIIDITERKRVLLDLAADYPRQRRIAETLQLSMLVKPRVDGFAGLRIGTAYAPCRDEALVGGDFFDAFELGEGRVALVVGDIAGKGLDAASRTIETKYALRAFLQEGHDPATAVRLLNQFLCESALRNNNGGESFVAFALVSLHAESGHVEFVLAGGEPPMIIRAGRPPVLVQARGLVLGVDSGWDYCSESSYLESGDTILMATDGVTEARSGADFLGAEGLARIAEDLLRSEPVDTAGNAMIDAAIVFAGGRLADDACILLFQLR